MESLQQFCLCFLPIIIKVSADRNQDLISSDMEQYFMKETMLKIPNNPNQIAVNLITNTLYFSFDSGEEEYIPAIFHMDNNALTVLSGVNDAFAISSNRTSSEVFFGGSFGIYNYDSKSKTLKKLARDNLDIWCIFIHKSDIYFTKFPNLNIFRYSKRLIEPLPQLANQPIHQFVVDLNDDIYFINNTGLYKTATEEPYIRLINRDHNFVSLSIDNNGQIYVCDYEAIYTITDDEKFIRVVSVRGVLSMTFDRDNSLIYTNSHEFTRLVPFRCMKDLKADTNLALKRVEP